MQFKHLFFTITFLLNLLLTSFAQEPTLLDHGGGVRTVEFSPVDASLIASAGESNIIKLWNLKNDTVRTLRGHTDIVNSIAFSPNGALLASVSDDRDSQIVGCAQSTKRCHSSRTLQMVFDGKSSQLPFLLNGQFLATVGW